MDIMIVLVFTEIIWRRTKKILGRATLKYRRRMKKF